MRLNRVILYDKMKWYEPELELIPIRVLPEDDPLLMYYKSLKRYLHHVKKI